MYNVYITQDNRLYFKWTPNEAPAKEPIKLEAIGNFHHRIPHEEQTWDLLLLTTRSQVDKLLMRPRLWFHFFSLLWFHPKIMRWRVSSNTFYIQKFYDGKTVINHSTISLFIWHMDV